MHPSQTPVCFSLPEKSKDKLSQHVLSSNKKNNRSRNRRLQCTFSHIPIYNVLSMRYYFQHNAQDAQLSRGWKVALMRNRVHWNRVNHPRQWLVAVAEHDWTPVFAYGVRSWSSCVVLCTRMDSAFSIMRPDDHLALLCDATLNCTTRSRAINR